MPIDDVICRLLDGTLIVLHFVSFDKVKMSQRDMPTRPLAVAEVANLLMQSLGGENDEDDLSDSQSAQGSSAEPSEAGTDAENTTAEANTGSDRDYVQTNFDYSDSDIESNPDNEYNPSDDGNPMQSSDSNGSK